MNENMERKTEKTGKPKSYLIKQRGGDEARRRG